jgi:glycine/D-amino acid oxidase-like deaminating enzyme
VFENAAATSLAFESPLRLDVSGSTVRAHRILFATNAMSLELSGLGGLAEPKFTLAVATEPLTVAQLDVVGLASERPFYTIDFPYLWGRLLPTKGVIFGSGLVHLSDWRELYNQDISMGQAAELIARLERRVHGLHPALANVQFTHRWGGPILIAEGWRPIFMQHPQSSHAIVLGAYSGHGVALSVYLGRWAAETMLGRRGLPCWDTP